MANNKLLLIEDVQDLGRSGDIVSVKPGYARNFLLPQGVAVIADKRTIRMQARLQEERLKQAVADKAESEELAARLEGVVVEKVVKVDHDGHMYGSVTAQDVAELLNAQNMPIEKRHVVMKQPIKTVGDFPVQLKLKEGVIATVTVKITPEAK